MPETAVAILGGLLPHGNQNLFHRAKRLVLWNAGVGHAAHALLQNFGVVLLCEIAVLGKIFVAVMRHQTKQRLL